MFTKTWTHLYMSFLHVGILVKFFPSRYISIYIAEVYLVFILMTAAAALSLCSFYDLIEYVFIEHSFYINNQNTELVYLRHSCRLGRKSNADYREFLYKL